MGLPYFEEHDPRIRLIRRFDAVRIFLAAPATTHARRADELCATASATRTRKLSARYDMALELYCAAARLNDADPFFASVDVRKRSRPAARRSDRQHAFPARRVVGNEKAARARMVPASSS